METFFHFMYGEFLENVCWIEVKRALLFKVKFRYLANRRDS